ncbi:arylsulfatase [Starkeya sp. ORNL1]|uniref:aspartate/glutamate racemase family protein n=1 Tax=Starkeya sp. ORNL1 TaxID=2709380 RepID=UPI0014630C91|nr:aspartate/glutamate racemase family protein [Starkeya sp. ORNL1]QJP15812.1 arylsulfatase [Starkeya sp. ORNL1]
MTARPRIALIHATPVAMAPIQAAFAADWPEAELTNLLDDSLSIDRARSKEMTPELTDRIVDLARHARRTGADAILYTCSAFGAAIDQAAREFLIPVLKPNEAMFETAFAAGARIGMLATFPPAVASMEEEFAADAHRLGCAVTLRTVLAAGAMDALRGGDAATHNRLVAEAAVGMGDVDVVMLAHFSTAQAEPAVAARIAVPVLTSPRSAIAKLRPLLAV